MRATPVFLTKGNVMLKLLKIVVVGFVVLSVIFTVLVVISSCKVAEDAKKKAQKIPYDFSKKVKDTVKVKSYVDKTITFDDVKDEIYSSSELKISFLSDFYKDKRVLWKGKIEQISLQNSKDMCVVTVLMKQLTSEFIDSDYNIYHPIYVKFELDISDAIKYNKGELVSYEATFKSIKFEGLSYDIILYNALVI